MTVEARTIGLTVPLDWRQVYETIWQPDFFPRWASGFSRSTLEPDGDAWRGEGPNGSVSIRFTDHNEDGVMDHVVETLAGEVIHVPLRVIANGDGTEVLLTLFRRPGMSDSAFAADADWVRRDLGALRDLLTAPGTRSGAP